MKGTPYQKAKNEQGTRVSASLGGFRRRVDDRIGSSSGNSKSQPDQSTFPTRWGVNEATPLAVVTVDQQVLEENGIDLKSTSLKPPEQLSKLPKEGKIYADVESINERLKDLSESHRKASIKEGLEIADAASLWRLLGKSNHEIDLAGQMAQRVSLLMLQSKMVWEKGRELIAQSKRKLRSADLKTIKDQPPLESSETSTIED